MGMSGFRFQMEEDKVGGAVAYSSYALYIYGLSLPAAREDDNDWGQLSLVYC